MNELNDKEKRLLFIALNNLQNQGLHNLGQQLERLDCVKTNPLMKHLVDTWIKDSVEEHDTINQIKAKLDL